MQTRDELIGEIRYAIRLTQRTTRLYRHIQTLGTILGILGGSGTVSTLISAIPAWVGLTGAALLTAVGALLVAVRPADKAAQNEADTRRYQALMVKAKNSAISDEQLAIALEEARQSDAPEIEALREIAYNDVVRELNRTDQLIQLSRIQKVLAVFA